MKKIIFVFTIIVFVFSCKNEVRHTVNKKETPIQHVNNLPFGEGTLINYPFKKGIWFDDYKNKDLQTATTFLYKDNYINFKKIKINNLDTIVKNKIYNILDIKKNYVEKIIFEDYSHLLFQDKILKICYIEVKLSDIKNDFFKNQDGGYILTLDKSNKLIDYIRFNHILYYSNTISERWNFCNVRLSYMNKSKTLTIYDFQCKEWDMNYQYKLIDKNIFQISKTGKITRLK